VAEPPDRPSPSRRADRTPPSGPRWRLPLLVGLVAAGLWLIFLAVTADPAATPTRAVAAAPTTTLAPACADALALADDLAGPAERLGNAAVDHVVIMERLDLFLKGKPGGLNGHQVYQLGAGQMKVMEVDGPDAQVRAKRYREVRKACPLK
jgi:hypothetical protein